MMTEATPKLPPPAGKWVKVPPPHEHCEAFLADRGSRCVLVLTSVVADPEGTWWYFVSVGRVTSMADKRFSVPTGADIDYARRGFDMVKALELNEPGSPARNLWLHYPRGVDDE